MERFVHCIGFHLNGHIGRKLDVGRYAGMEIVQFLVEDAYQQPHAEIHAGRNLNFGVVARLQRKAHVSGGIVVVFSSTGPCCRQRKFNL
ncbi:hypothetical protein SDC9_190803 [bioreactor metagenome]|uniref:Uncharacterized protein n=1 Tax=bioreactor metagenome TaxID=1076179 RepID=A0A645I498_9ZZZZ